MGVTLKDIAKITGVSHTTVSRALNDNNLISEETRKRIKKVAKELNYVPNYNARNLVLDKSHLIGLFFSTLGNGTSSDFFQQSVVGVNNAIGDKYNVVVKGIDEYENFSLINSKSFDGIIIISQSDEDNCFIYDVKKKNIPLVVLNRDIREEKIVNILSDDKKGARDIVKYLIDKGHKKIAIIEGKQNFKSSTERKEGYIDAMLEAKLQLIEEYMIKGEYNLQSGYIGMKQILNLKNVPTAVFCLNDDMALGAINATYENGLKIPEDISIVGFDDSVFSEYITPSLTTVKRNVELMSSEGVRCLMNLIKNGSSSNNKYYIKTELVVRKSTKEI